MFILYHSLIFRFCHVFACVLPALYHSYKCSSTYILWDQFLRRWRPQYLWPQYLKLESIALSVCRRWDIGTILGIPFQPGSFLPWVDCVTAAMNTNYNVAILLFRLQSRNCDGTRALIYLSWMCGRDQYPFYPCEALLCPSWSSCSTSADGPWLAWLLLRVLQDHSSAYGASQAWPEWEWSGVWSHLPIHPRLWFLGGSTPER